MHKILKVFASKQVLSLPLTHGVSEKIQRPPPMNGTPAGKGLASPTVGETGTGRPIAGRTLLVVTLPGPVRRPANSIGTLAQQTADYPHPISPKFQL